MFTKVTLFLFAGVFAAFMCFAADQDTTTTTTTTTTDTSAQNATAASQNSMVTGVVENVDLQRNTLRVKDETSRSSQEILLSETTTVTKEDSTSGTLQELKKGDRILVEVDSTNTAVKVSLEPPSSTSPESEKPKN